MGSPLPDPVGDFMLVIDREFEGVMMAPVLNNAVVGFAVKVIHQRGVVRDRINLPLTPIRSEKKTFAPPLGGFGIASNGRYHREVHGHAVIQKGPVQLFEALGRRKCVRVVVANDHLPHITVAAQR